MGFSRQEHLSGLPFPSPVDHILSELSTMTCPSWAALYCMAHSFIELDKAMVHVIRLVSFLWLWFSVCRLMGRIRGLWKLPDGRDWLKEKLGFVLMRGAMLRKSLNQFSVEGWGCVPSLLFGLRPNYDGGNGDNGSLLQKVPCRHCCTQCLQTCSRAPPTHASAGDSWTLMSKSGSVLWGFTAPFNL